MNFPATRMRRLRSTAALRSLVRETHLQPSMLINPIFLCEGEGFRREISSMPGVFNLSIDEAVKEVEACAALGIGGVLLFGIPHEKDELGTGAYASDGIVQRGLRAIKATKASQSLVTVADVCLCEYTSHGHCGIVARDGEHFSVENDSSVALLAKTAASLAEAGADIVAPSDMMDGRVAAIRRSMKPISSTRPSCPTPQSSRRPSMAPSARRPTRLRSSATAARIRWTAPICAKPCARSSRTSSKAPTCC
jgi:porphobilinogen synthase